MNLKDRVTPSQGGRLYTVAGAARALGISDKTLERLVAQGVVTTLRADDTRRQVHIFTDADLQRVIAYYAAKGGARKLPKRSD